MIFRTVSAILFNLSSFSDSVANSAAVITGVEDGRCVVMDLVCQVSVPVLSGET